MPSHPYRDWLSHGKRYFEFVRARDEHRAKKREQDRFKRVVKREIEKHLAEVL